MKERPQGELSDKELAAECDRLFEAGLADLGYTDQDIERCAKFRMPKMNAANVSNASET